MRAASNGTHNGKHTCNSIAAMEDSGKTQQKTRMNWSPVKQAGKKRTLETCREEEGDTSSEEESEEEEESAADEGEEEEEVGKMTEEPSGPGTVGGRLLGEEEEEDGAKGTAPGRRERALQRTNEASQRLAPKGDRGDQENRSIELNEDNPDAKIS